MKSVHKGLKYDCDMCEVKFASTGSVSTHRKNVHLKATVYGAKTLTETMNSMMVEVNSGWKCIQCGKENKGKWKGVSKNLLRMHIESEHMGMTHTCGMCGHTYKTRDTFRNHFQTSACNVENLAKMVL